jgi:hypothetical protein
MIEQQFGDWRPWRRGKVAEKKLPVASLVGAYLGEVMIRHFGGHWGWMPDSDVAAVQLPSGTRTSPPAKAQKRFGNGKEHSPLVTFPHTGPRRGPVTSTPDRDCETIWVCS